MAALQELSNDQLRRSAPSVFAERPWRDVSDKYAFIPTIGIVDALRDEGFVPVRAEQSRTRVEGKGDFTKHMLRFRRAETLRALSVGAEIPEVVLVNSHDRSGGFQLSAGIFRLVCSNGMTVKSGMLGDISVRHVGDVAEEVVRASYKIISEMPLVEEQVERFKSLQLSPEAQDAYAEAALQLRYPAREDGTGSAPIPHRHLLMARRREDFPNDLWTTFNRVQENFMRGGLRGRGTTGKRLSTRPIASVTEDLRLNKALWLLTERMAELAP